MLKEKATGVSIVILTYIGCLSLTQNVNENENVTVTQCTQIKVGQQHRTGVEESSSATKGRMHKSAWQQKVTDR